MEVQMGKGAQSFGKQRFGLINFKDKANSTGNLRKV